MAEKIEDLTISYSEGETELTKELKKEVLTKGAWSTVMYMFQDRRTENDEFSVPKFTIRRYQKSGGEYKQKSKFNISNVEQAKKVIATLQKWVDEHEDENKH